jgi:quinol monooxygenase YgiN
MSVVLVATVTPKPGQLEAVVAAFEATIPLVHTEDGCELYSLHKTEDTVVMIEKWASQEALTVHGGGETLKALGRQLRELTSERMQLVVLEPVPAGDPAKGAL